MLMFAFAFAEFRLAWACALVIILAAETRAQTGERVERTILFWIHLCSAVPFFLALSALAFFVQPLWLVLLTAALGLVAFYTGGILWYRGLQARMLHLNR